jgi:ribosomal protein S18 acetylase RimI-like enzyme
MHGSITTAAIPAGPSQQLTAARAARPSRRGDRPAAGHWSRRRTLCRRLNAVGETAPVPAIRRATAEDRDFLEEMLAVAADWRPGTHVRSVAEILAQPALAHYVAGWPAEGDVGFIAEVGQPVAAAWWRYFHQDDPGFGFVDDTVPEVSIGIVADARGQGLGTLLLEALIEEARQRALSALSLSVDPDNRATGLYRRLGFVTVSHVGGSLTMLLKLRT